KGAGSLSLPRRKLSECESITSRKLQAIRQRSSGVPGLFAGFHLHGQDPKKFLSTLLAPQLGSRPLRGGAGQDARPDVQTETVRTDVEERRTVRRSETEP